MAGPQESIPAKSRRSYNVNSYVTSFDVSTKVVPTGGNVVCERAMYGNDRTWAHDSIGALAPPASQWYLAEGSTDGGMETWVLVQNPETAAAAVNIVFQTDAGEVAPPTLQGVTIPAESRRSFKVNDYVTTYNVSTRVDCTSGGVVCERAMYGNDRAWAHESVGVTSPSVNWYLAEGSTDGGMETFVLVQNPGSSDTTADIKFQTDAGEVAPPALQGVTIPASVPAYLQGQRLRHHLQRLHPGHIGRGGHLRAGHVRQRAGPGRTTASGRYPRPPYGTWRRDARREAWRNSCWCRTPRPRTLR